MTVVMSVRVPRLHLPLRVGSVFCLPIASACAWGEVVIIELWPAQSDRLIRWSATGVPKLGMGRVWQELTFNDANWSTGTLPAGWGHANMSTNLQSRMQSKTPSVYLRKTFEVTAAQIAENLPLMLDIEMDDGFVAYLNGVEIARANTGPAKHFVYASQPAYNTTINSSLQALNAGSSGTLLVEGTNVLAIQAHNRDLTSAFKTNAGLRTSTTTFIAAGTAGGNWKYFVGIAEPSGGAFDPSLVTFPIPSGEEEDFEGPNRFVDWVELHNNGAESVNLTNWALSDELQAPGKWKFPAGTSIAAGGYLLILCDGREEANGTASYLHASFALTAGGGELVLSDEGGAVRDSLVPYPRQNPFYSFGRTPDSVGAFAYQAMATPNEANQGETLSGIAEAPIFLAGDAVTPKPGGFYSGSQTLAFVTATPDSQIRLTRDGSEPTETTGEAYVSPITISSPNDRTGVVIRARAFKAGMIPSDIATNTYLINQNAALRTLPALILNGSAQRSFFSPLGVTSIVGGSYDGNGLWQPSGPTSYNIPMQRGDAYERAISVEWRKANSTEGIQNDAGLRIAASPYTRPRLRLTSMGASPWTPTDPNYKPSFNLYFRDDYGASRLNHPVFANSNVTEFKGFRVRSGKNDISNPFIIDELARRLWLDLGWVGVHGTFNTLYVNGSFKGYYNLAERIREPMLQEHYRTGNEWDINYINDFVDGNSTEWNIFMNRISQPLDNLSNYALVKEKADLTAIADYYILNIYAAMWDWATWPNAASNNFAFARERSPAGRWRPLMWDAEGAFGVVGGNGVSFNLITQNLTGPDDTGSIALIWKRLVGTGGATGSKEFRLLVADRINKLMFNGGVLDDRIPNNRLKFHKDALVAQIQPLMTFVLGQTLNQGFYNTWTNSSFGRRTYLLGPNGTHFRTAGVWPVTPPPVFSQHGGTVPAGYQLTFAAAPTGAKLFYTLDGSDPRVEGGALHSSAVEYLGPITLNQVTTVKSRSQSTTGEWSALTEAVFVVAAVPATAGNLIISEVMYHPPEPTAAERTAGVADADDFEFVRLTNIGTAPVSLAGVHLSMGISFDFGGGTIAAINPGASVLVVRKRAAFQARYGNGLNAMIAGEYTGRMSNSGDQLQLELTGGAPAILESFQYDTEHPWPDGPDGKGPSMVLIDPFSAPNPADGRNWTSSAPPGGTPGGAAGPMTYALWKAMVFSAAEAADDMISGVLADADGDGLTNWAEYALGGLPKHFDSATLFPTSSVVTIEGNNYLALTYTMQSGASETTATVQVSPDLATWLSGPPHTEQVGPLIVNANGSTTRTIRDTTPVNSASQRYLRLQMLEQ